MPLITISPPQPHEYEIEYLQRCLHAANEKLQEQETELEECRAQIERDNRIVYHINEQIATLEDLVHKQKMTISNQSKTISDPRLVRRVQMSSSSSPASISGPVGTAAGGGLFSLTPQPQLPQQQGHHQLPGVAASTAFETTRSQQLPIGGGVFETSPTTPSAFDIGSGGNSIAPGLVSQSQDQTTLSSLSSSLQTQAVHQAQPAAGTQIPLVWDPVSGTKRISLCASGYLDPATCLSEFASRYRELWAKTELFGQAHANTPNVFKDSHLEKSVKDYIMMVSDKYGASSLLGSHGTRFFLVAKAINNFLAREVLKVSVIKGFDDQGDAEVGYLKRQIYPGEYPFPLTLSVLTRSNCTRHPGSYPTPDDHIHRLPCPNHQSQARFPRLLAA